MHSWTANGSFCVWWKVGECTQHTYWVTWGIVHSWAADRNLLFLCVMQSEGMHFTRMLGYMRYSHNLLNTCTNNWKHSFLVPEHIPGCRIWCKHTCRGRRFLGTYMFSGSLQSADLGSAENHKCQILMQWISRQCIIVNQQNLILYATTGTENILFQWMMITQVSTQNYIT